MSLRHRLANSTLGKSLGRKFSGPLDRGWGDTFVGPLEQGLETERLGQDSTGAVLHGQSTPAVPAGVPERRPAKRAK